MVKRVMLYLAFFMAFCLSEGHAENIVYDYDDRNQVLSAVYQDGSTMTFSYDPAGNRTVNSVTPGSDTDGDGLSDYLEGLAGTGVDDQDSDDDGLQDGMEDTNRNGWKDAGETAAVDPDTDSDGMDDGWETTYGLNPLGDDANGDKDGDGFTNLEEYQADTNPDDENSFPETPAVAALPWWGFGVAAFFIILAAVPLLRRKTPGSGASLILVGLLCAALLPPEALAGLPQVRRISAQPVAPEQAREILSSRDVTAQGLPAMGAMGAATVSSDISALARALKNDVDLIYEYVYNNIAYKPIFGSIKGATGTLIDQCGNDFDQAALMIALLREAGYTAGFKYGVIRLGPDQVENWLGVAQDSTAIGGLLGSAGIPSQVYLYGGGEVAYVDMNHVWVQVTIEGTDYVFDPSFKTHTVKPGIDLASAMGYDQAGFLSNALVGTSVGADYLEDVNKANMAADMTAYADNLIDTIRTQHPSATLSDIVGGLEIDPVTMPLRQTALPHQQTVTDTWTAIPAAYRTTLRVQHAGIDLTLYSDEIYGKRLSIFYNLSNQPVLRLDGSPLATGNSTTAGTYVSISLSVDHPYAANGGTYADQNFTFSILAGGSFAVSNGWSEVTANMVEHHRAILNENLAAGLPDTDETVLGETLAMMGFAWLAECDQSDRLMDRVTGTFTIHHHNLGICGQTSSPYVDMPMSLVSVASKTADSDLESAGFFTSSGRASALEWGMIEQYQPNSAVCTVKLIDLANTQSHKIFDVTSTNWNSVQGQLTGFSSNELNHVSSYINAGYRVILPQDGDLGEGTWQGVGFLAITPDNNGVAHIISGGHKGGFGDVPYDADPGETSSSGGPGDTANSHDQSKEPIDLVTGHYLYKNSDITVGSSQYPFSLGFGRSYNSGARFKNGDMGRGWTHNWEITAQKDSNGFLAMGDRTAVDAAAVIAEIFVSTDLLLSSKAQDRVVVATLAHRWFMDQLIENVVAVQEPGNVRQFIRLANGSYNPQPGDASVLTREPDGSFLMQDKYGAEYDFDTDGNLTTWTDLNGNQVTLSYALETLQSITNGMGRTLTLTYTNDHLTQVSDGNGRSVSYGYDVSHNLVLMTDPEGNDTVYEYDLPGRLTKIFYPANPANPYVTNSYGTDDRIVLQTDANGNEWTYYLAGSRAEEVNPLTDSTVLYFDRNGNTIRKTDALGHETTYEYDGLGRLVRTTLPEGNAVAYTYDDRHNTTSITKEPKPGSGLTTVQQTYTYHPVFNRVATSTDPLGRTISYQYDAEGNLERIEKPQVGGETPVTLMTANSRGQLLTLTDPEGRITRYTYDGTTGNRLSMTVDDVGMNLTTSYSYDAVGNLETLTDPNGNTSTYVYDLMRRKTRKTEPAPFNHVTQYGYDEDGNLTQISRQTGDPLEPWQTETASYTYSGKKHVVSDPAGDTTTHAYDAADRLWKVTNAEGQTTEYLYDPLGRLRQKIEPGPELAEEHLYTPNGLKASVADANGNLTQYAYDGLDRLSVKTFPDSSFEHYSYDDADNLMQKRTRSDQTIIYGYDALNRLTSKTLAGSQIITYTYDLTGLMEDVTDSRGTLHHDYDNALRLTGVLYPGGRTVGYAYDANGNKTRITYPNGSYVTYEYDEMNRLVEVLQDGATSLAHYSYDDLSRRIGLTLGNGNTLGYAYQPDDDLEGLSLTHNGGTVQFSFVTDGIGIVTQVGVDDFRFVYRPSPGLSNTYSINDLNQYTAVGGTPFSYDANGNLASDGVNSYTYNIENRLVASTTPAGAVTYSYDPLGRRIEKVVAGNTTEYLHAGHQVLVEYNGAGQELRRYVYGINIDEPLCMIAPSGTYFYALDGLRSAIALSDTAGDLQEIYAYGVYGEPNGSSLLGNPYLHASRAHDAETGLYYYRTRYYDPSVGRFLQTDPAGFAGGMNLYEYVQNNPTNFVDPWGLWTLQIGVSGTAGAGGGGTAGGGFVFGFSWENGFQFGTYEVAGGGGYGGVSASGVVDVTFSTNTDINDLSGLAGTVGGSGGEGISIGGEVNIPQGDADPSWTFSIGGGGGTPVELHGFVTNTWVQEWTGKK